MNLAAKLDALARNIAIANTAKAASTSRSISQDSQDSRALPVPEFAGQERQGSETRSFRNFRIRKGESAAESLERLAKDNDIDWLAARSEMITGDADSGAMQLIADSGDGVEVASVLCWLRLLEARAIRFGWRRGLPANGSMHRPETRPIDASERE